MTGLANIAGVTALGNITVQQIMFSYDGLYPPDEIIQAVRTGKAGAFCLFTHRNVSTPAQVRESNLALYAAAREGGQPPPIIGIDQEGGQLMAISVGATELPGNMALGATRSTELAAKAGRVLGRELLAMGINLNFAPALDVNVNPRNAVIGIRAFGDDPTLVGELGAAMLHAMQAEGVIATAKHFPGHGDTSADSHFAVPTNHHPMSRLEAVELLPFRRAIAAGVQAVMTAHVVFDAVDPGQLATQSRIIIQQLLRNQLGFDGLVLTDALDMFAVARNGGAAGVRSALEAGADLALLAHLPDQFALAEAMQPLLNAESVQRIARVRQGLPQELPPLSVVGCDEHRAIAQDIADRSITLVRDNGQLPLRLEHGEPLVVITVQPVDLTPADTSSLVTISLADALRQRYPNVTALELPFGATDAEVRAVLEAADGARVVVGTIAATDDPAQGALVQALEERGQSPIVVAMRTPYDILSFPRVATYLCAYGIRPVTCEAIARVLFGEIVATGLLPCAIPGVEQTTTLLPAARQEKPL